MKDPDGDRDSGFDDTIVPVDFESNGQIDSDKLHKTLVSPLPPESTMSAHTHHLFFVHNLSKVMWKCSIMLQYSRRLARDIITS